MKKLLLLTIVTLLLTSCFKAEVSEKFLMKNYDEINKTFNLSGNSFDKLPEFSKYLSWELLKNVENVRLSKNEMSIITLRDSQNLSIFTNLKKLDLSNNKFKLSSNIYLPDTIEELDLSNNQLEDLKGLANLKNLRKLYLSNNNLDNKDILELAKLKKLKRLKKLVIDWNNLTKEFEDKINNRSNK